MQLTQRFFPSKTSVTLHDGQRMPVMVVGQGEPVVLVHGFGMESSMWLPFVLPLAGQFQFYLPQLRGFGAASRSRFSQSDFIAEYVSDITAMRDQLGLDNIRLGGISMGSLTNLALHAAGQFDGVTHLLHIDQSPVMHNTIDWSWGLMGDKQPEFFSLLSELCDMVAPYQESQFSDLPMAVKKTLMTAISTMIGASFHSKLMRSAATLMPKYPDMAAKLRDTSGWQNQIHIVRGYLEHAYDFRESLQQIEIPVTVVTGMSSRLYDAEGQAELVKLLPNATHVRLKNTGHATLFDDPKGSYAALKQFLLAS